MPPRHHEGVRAPGRGIAALALVLAAALPLAGCGGDEPPARPEGGRLAVTLDDFLIEPQRVRAAPGRLTFRATNEGRLGHTLVIRRGERDIARVKTLLPGASGEATTSLRARRVRPRVHPRQPRGARDVRHPGRAMKAVDPRHFRSVMGNFATGVTVITATGPSGPVGMTANALASLSLEPLLLLVAFDNSARTLTVVRDTRRFGVNVLAAGQEELARLFASKLPEEEKFAGVPHTLHDGLPVIDDSLAWVGCRLEQLVPGGDHTIGIGAVESAEASDGRPLIWFRGEYR